MGWGNCGTDSKGRPIGYIFDATCDHPDCIKEINRGLDYACGGMHGETEFGCEKYFCYDHLIYSETAESFLCKTCYEMVEGELKDAEIDFPPELTEAE